MAGWRGVALSGWAIVLLTNWALAAGMQPADAAQHVDELLAKELFGGSEGTPHALTALADDQTFLRRASLDLIGHAPTPEDITLFSLDTSSDKRVTAVDRLLANDKFGENWARYWRDVIFYRRSEDRSLIAGPAVVKMLSEAFNGDERWNEIAKKFITAKGDVREEGATALIMAQMASPEDTTAEISRIFLGIQIQCAQCHNHPTDRWKREQFHELAAFFPRMAVRTVRQGEKRSFEIVSVDRERPDKAKNKPKRGHLEHRMPDLKHPEEEGKLMRPVFFVTGQKLAVGATDEERREKIAEWITSRNDRWFAKAFVNRMWAELVGHGFYEPVDDMGPDRACSAPNTLNFLAERFAGSGYDVKWLMRVITATQAYQRDSRSRYEEGEAPFAANCPQRLRADQLFNSLSEVMGFDEAALEKRGGKNDYRAALAGPRGQMNATFGYDPSERRDEVVSSIPQALMLMNGPAISRGLAGNQPNTALGKLLKETDDDRGVVEELYLRSLGREPSDEEVKTCLDYVGKVGKRAEAFEDVLWALVNSTEFLHRK